MLTKAQQKWIDHLPDNNKITIAPFDSTSQLIFKAVKQRVQGRLGIKTPVLHCGATSLGISGQDEIDIYIPVPEDKFDEMILKLSALFGEPRSNYPLQRARFITNEAGKHIEVFLINEASDGWINVVRFETYLKKHPEKLKDYQLLKEDGNGLSTRKYYRRKIEFINEILKEAGY